jgi:hypothetical protein
MSSNLEWNLTCFEYNSTALVDVAKVVEQSIFEGVDPQLSNEVLEHVLVTGLCGKAVQSHDVLLNSSVRLLQAANMSEIILQMQITETGCVDPVEGIFSSVNSALNSIVSDGTLTSFIRRNSTGRIQAVINRSFVISSFSFVSDCPTMNPTHAPSSMPSKPPSAIPSSSPSLAPTRQPSTNPSSSPSSSPSLAPSVNPSLSPSSSPSNQPSANPSSSPSFAPSTPPSHSPTSSPTQRDIYRTCFQRAIDPSNDLPEDTIFRDMNSTEPQCESLAEMHSPPYYVPEEEELTYGTVYLSIVRNNNTNLTCNDQLDLEEIALEWLYVSTEPKL